MKSFIHAIAKPIANRHTLSNIYLTKVPLFHFSSLQYELLSKQKPTDNLSEMEKMKTSSTPSNFFDDSEMEFIDEFQSTERTIQDSYQEIPGDFSPENSEALFQQFMRSIDPQAMQMPQTGDPDPESDDASYNPNSEEMSYLRSEMEKMKDPEYMKTINVSKKMLENPDMDIQQAASELGTTAEALLKTFTQRFGSDAEEGEVPFRVY